MNLNQHVVRMASGNSESAQVVDTECRPRLHAYLRRYVDLETAEDLAQITMLKVWKNAASYMPQKNCLTWVLTIAHRVLIDHLRAESRRQRVSVESVDWIEKVMSHREENPHCQVDCAELRTLATQVAADRIPGGNSVLDDVLRGLTASEVSVRDKVPVSTVLWRRNAVLRAIRESPSFLGLY